jgi:hypothetical protein
MMHPAWQLIYLHGRLVHAKLQSSNMEADKQLFVGRETQFFFFRLMRVEHDRKM